METSKLPGLLRFIVFHNRFYLISTALFVYGLKLLFRPDSPDVLFQAGTVGYIPPSKLLLSLSAVTLLMTVTAVGVVRRGRVWDDARSLMLIVLLCCLQAVFMLTTPELLLRGMRLSWFYRGLLYLLLLPAVRRGSGLCRDNGTPWG